MYVILVNTKNYLIVTQKERIMQRSNMVDSLWFLVPPDYNDHAMANYTVSLEYILPVSRKYKVEFLTLSEERYNSHLVYKLPFNTTLTEEAGDIELQLSFNLVELDANGKGIQRTRKTSPTTITIVPISAWSDIIPDSALSALDQRIIKTDAQIKALNDYNNMLAKTKADDISYDPDNNEIQLMADGSKIGSKITIKSPDDIEENGVPVVDFSDLSVNPEPDDTEDDDSVIEF